MQRFRVSLGSGSFAALLILLHDHENLSQFIFPSPASNDWVLADYATLTEAFIAVDVCFTTLSIKKLFRSLSSRPLIALMVHLNREIAAA